VSLVRLTNHPTSVLWHCWLGHQLSFKLILATSELDLFKIESNRGLHRSCRREGGGYRRGVEEGREWGGFVPLPGRLELEGQGASWVGYFPANNAPTVHSCTVKLCLCIMSRCVVLWLCDCMIFVCFFDVYYSCSVCAPVTPQ